MTRASKYVNHARMFDDTVCSAAKQDGTGQIDLAHFVLSATAVFGYTRSLLTNIDDNEHIQFFSEETKLILNACFIDPTFEADISKPIEVILFILYYRVHN